MKDFFVCLQRYWLLFFRSGAFWIFFVLMIFMAIETAGIAPLPAHFLSWITGIKIGQMPYSAAEALAAYKVQLIVFLPVLCTVFAAVKIPSGYFMIHALVAGRKPAISDRLSLYAVIVFYNAFALTASSIVFYLFSSARFGVLFLELQLKMFLQLQIYALTLCAVCVLASSLFRTPAVRTGFTGFLWAVLIILLRWDDLGQRPFFSLQKDWSDMQVAILVLFGACCLVCSILTSRFRYHSPIR